MDQKNFSFRCIAFQEKDHTYTAVCLDLDIVEEGYNTINEAILSVDEAIISHMKTAAELGFPKELIERPAPKEYWNKVKDLIGADHPQSQFEPFQLYTTPSRTAQYA